MFNNTAYELFYWLSYPAVVFTRDVLGSEKLWDVWELRPQGMQAWEVQKNKGNYD